MAQQAKHEDQNSNPQDPHKKPTMAEHVCNPSTGEQSKQISRTHWLAGPPPQNASPIH